MLFTGLITMACSACFLIESTHNRQNLAHCSLINKMLAAGSYGDIFSAEVPSSQKTLACVKLKNTNQVV